MNQKLQDSPHRLGVSFAAVALIAGMAVAVMDLKNGARPMEVLEVGAYTIGIAVLCYIVVRLVGWVFAEILATTREHRARRS